MCFGLSTGILAIGTYDRRFQQGEMLWTVQRENELGYTYDVYDMRIQNMTFVDWQVKTKIYLVREKPIPAGNPKRMIIIFVCPNRFGDSIFRVWKIDIQICLVILMDMKWWIGVVNETVFYGLAIVIFQTIPPSIFVFLVPLPPPSWTVLHSLRSCREWVHHWYTQLGSSRHATRNWDVGDDWSWIGVFARLFDRV